MKTKWFNLILLLILSNNLLSQITFQSSNYIVPGDSILISVAPEAQLTGYNFDTSGVNFSWIFDTLPALTQHWYVENDPDVTGYYSSFLLGIPYLFPGCIESCIEDGSGNLFTCTNSCNNEWDALTNSRLLWDTINLQAFKIYNINDFYANTGTSYEKRLFGYKVDISGLSGELTTILDSSDILYRFPLAYGNADSSESSYKIDLNLGFVYKHQQKRINNVDGWGSLKTPYKTYQNTIRLKSFVHNIDKFIFTAGDTIDLSAILPDTIIEYKWFDLDLGIPVLTVKSIIYNGTKIYVNAEYADTLRCLDPQALFGYLPVPTYLDISTDSVKVNFYNLSVNYNSIQWNFGDSISGSNNISNTSNPIHWFTSQGIYLTELIVCNSMPQCSSVFCDTIKLPVVVIDTSLVYANFVFHPFFPCAGDSVLFTNTSVNDSAWYWDFDDGYFSADENPAHLFSSTGLYNVKLVAYKGNYSDTIIKQIKIASTPDVSFIYSDSVSLVPVQFTNTSIGVDTNTSYLWTFSGGKPSVLFSVEENPLITFEQQDSVNVCLLALNSLGCAQSSCNTIYITKCLEAKFKTNGLSNSFCVNDNISCTNQTTTGLAFPVSYSWYSDGLLVSNNTNTNISFTQTGSYTIMLVADNSVCTDTVIKIIYIKSNAVLYSAGNDTTLCTGDSIVLQPSFTTGGQAGALYNWQPSTGLSATNIPNPVAYPDSATQYIFTFQIIGGVCDILFSDKDTIEISVDSCLINVPQLTQSDDQKILVYPNPASGFLNIKFDNSLLQKADISVSITDILGKEKPLYYSLENKKNSVLGIINTTSLTKGIYFLSVSGNGRKILNKKIIIE